MDTVPIALFGPGPFRDSRLDSPLSEVYVWVIVEAATEVCINICSLMRLFLNTIVGAPHKSRGSREK